MEQSQNKAVGSLKISEESIATIAGMAALEVKGVLALAQKSSVSKGILNKISSKAIKINLTENELTIDVYLIIANGTVIKDVAEAVQLRVKESVQSMTGMIVSKVNVHVVNIAFDEAPAN